VSRYATGDVYKIGNLVFYSDVIDIGRVSKIPKIFIELNFIICLNYLKYGKEVKKVIILQKEAYYIKKNVYLTISLLFSLLIIIFFIVDNNYKSTNATVYKVIKQEDIGQININEKQYEPWGFLYQKELLNKLENHKKKTIKIGIMDSGIDKNHIDLKNTTIIDYNAINPNEAIYDRLGHGTAIAGIIAANDNDFGIRGVSPDVELLSVKVLDDDGRGNIQDFVRGIKWCMDNEVDIINMSFGLQRDNAQLRNAIKQAVDKGIIIVSAVGNNYGRSVDFPAAYKEVISVTAIDSYENVLKSAAVGKVDFSSPGKDILTLSPDNHYAVYSGTSFASAYVTGVIATLLLHNNYSKTSDLSGKIKQELIAMSKDLGEKGYDNVYGNGSLTKN
jgi:subtilisin family serine protease